MLFRDRTDAGRQLATMLTHYADRPDVIVLALPRGGVPVAFEVASRLHAPLDVFMVRKLGVPGHEELAMGALASGGVQILNQELVDALDISDDQIAATVAQESAELTRRERAYRDDRPPIDVRGRTVILIDDGLATGATMRAAVAAVNRQKPAKLIVAVPVGAAETCRELRNETDETICFRTPAHFRAVGMWYQNFSQTTDDEVRTLLKQSGQHRASANTSH
ncbi:MAG TPA: phosphoribosyltransferase [Planctomycetaceae bacterium]|nr:phosphoribosyltransferase [Planctomycetaceae bacterium]